jgi:hypothetical protein
MSEVRKMLHDVLSQLDVARTLEHYEVNTVLEPAGKTAKESDESIDELKYEFIGVYLLSPVLKKAHLLY